MPALRPSIARNLTRESARAIDTARAEQRDAFQQVARRASEAADERQRRLEVITDPALRASAQR